MTVDRQRSHLLLLSEANIDRHISSGNIIELKQTVNCKIKLKYIKYVRDSKSGLYLLNKAIKFSFGLN